MTLILVHVAMLLAVSKNSLQGIFQIFENINLASTMIARFTGLAKCLLTCRSALTVPMAKANFVTVGCPGYRNIPRKATCSKGDTVTRRKNVGKKANLSRLQVMMLISLLVMSVLRFGVSINLLRIIIIALPKII